MFNINCRMPNLQLMKRILTVILIGSYLSGCTTGELISSVRSGMTRDQVENLLGRPDAQQNDGNKVVLKFADRLESGWSWDKADYLVTLVDDRVVDYGKRPLTEQELEWRHQDRQARAHLASGIGISLANSHSTEKVVPARKDGNYCPGLAPLGLPGCTYLCISGEWTSVCR